jgi:type IV secretion system protein VirB10
LPPPIAAAPPALPSPTTLPEVRLAPPREDPLQRRRAPAVVVDLGAAPRSATPGSSAASFVGVGQLPSTGAQPPAAAVQPVPPEALAPQAAPAVAMANPLNPAEAFAARLAGGPEVAIATPMRNPGFVVPQGAVIPAVLETAINSDLPGFARAVISRDVRSFDGRSVLIPRGSRLVGQYKSAVSLGQSRAFVVWTRVTRPDGVSVDIGSPAADELGRGGLEGEVDRHFFTRFGGSILLSVLNGIVASIGGNPSTTISIGSPAQAASAAASARQDEVSPTVKVAQGEAIRIFVARDLDFSLVGAMR